MFPILIGIGAYLIAQGIKDGMGYHHRQQQLLNGGSDSIRSLPSGDLNGISREQFDDLEEV